MMLSSYYMAKFATVFPLSSVYIYQVHSYTSFMLEYYKRQQCQVV